MKSVGADAFVVTRARTCPPEKVDEATVITRARRMADRTSTRIGHWRTPRLTPNQQTAALGNGALSLQASLVLQSQMGGFISGLRFGNSILEANS